MYSKTKFTLICLILLLFSIAVVSASDVNSTDLGVNNVDDSMAVENEDSKLNNAENMEQISAYNDSDNEITKSSNQEIIKSDDTVKSDTTINPVNTKVVTGNKLQVCLKDSNGKVIKNAKVTFKFEKKKYKTVTNSKGIANFKVTKDVGKYTITAKFYGDDKYNPVSKTFTFIVQKTSSIDIGNDILLTKGYLKVYLKSDYVSAIPGKTVTIEVGGKKFVKKVNSDGAAVVKPKLGKKTYLVTVTFDGAKYIAGSSASKNVTGIKGNPKSPFQHAVPSKNGVPDLDYMFANYIMGDENMKYTLLRAHYQDVIKKDSFCLFLNGKLTKYVFFKTKNAPEYMHMIKRTKWNVIEREINTRIVLKNKYNYWPAQVTVNLKGKSYTYPEVRDVQNTGYTCGPTSCSMCSQVLRNYVNEWKLSEEAGTSYYSGSSTSGLKRALEQFNMKCSYFYQSSFDNALDSLKDGGCALIFHTWSHYVAILDISKDGKKVLVGNPSGDYDTGSHGIPTNWLTVKYMKTCFNDYDTSGLIVKLNYNLNEATKNQINMFYNNMGAWSRGNTNERIPNT